MTVQKIKAANIPDCGSVLSTLLCCCSLKQRLIISTVSTIQSIDFVYSHSHITQIEEHDDVDSVAISYPSRKLFRS